MRSWVFVAVASGVLWSALSACSTMPASPNPDASADGGIACQAVALADLPRSALCGRCVVVPGAAGFCADETDNPTCVGGYWRCVGDFVPIAVCDQRQGQVCTPTGAGANQ